MLKKGYVEEGVQPQASLCDLQTTNKKKNGTQNPTAQVQLLS